MRRTLIDTQMAAVELGFKGTDAVRQLVKDGWLTNHGTPRRIRLDLEQVKRLERQGLDDPRRRAAYKRLAACFRT